MGALTLKKSDITEIVKDAIKTDRYYQDRKRMEENTANDWAAQVIRDATSSCGIDPTGDQFKTAMLKVATLAIEASQRNNQ